MAIVGGDGGLRFTAQPVNVTASRRTRAPVLFLPLALIRKFVVAPPVVAAAIAPEASQAPFDAAIVETLENAPPSADE